MSIFPALAPSTRIYTPGDIPLARPTSLTGISTGFRRGARRVSQTLQLTFSHLTQADMNLIKAHYYDRKGTYDIFFLPGAIWGDYAGTPPVPIISNDAWRYSANPQLVDVSFDRFTVQVALQTVPINSGDLIFDGEAAAATPARTYVLDGGAAAATPARDYVIQAFAAIQ